MDVLIHLFVGLHIIGIASLLGGFLTQMKAMGAGHRPLHPAMLHGALTMLVTGVVLVGLNQADDQTVNNIKIGMKLALLIVILGLVYVKRDEEKVDKGRSALVGAADRRRTSSSPCSGPDAERRARAGRRPRAQAVTRARPPPRSTAAPPRGVEPRRRRARRRPPGSAAAVIPSGNTVAQRRTS